MNILIVCQTLTYLSGSPLYHYTLALELKRQGHNVTVFSMWENNEMYQNLYNAGVTPFYDMPKGDFDLLIISQDSFKDVLDNVNAKKVINIVHSEYDCESPIIDPRIDRYVAIRKEVKDHLVNSHKIPKNKVKVVYNGIDFERFKEENRITNKNDYIKVVIPCTIDMLRMKFLNHYADKASEKYRVFIYGKSYGNKFEHNEFVEVHDEVFDIENKIADADIVAGILLGRVNLEARAMGIISFIHDPENPEKYQVFNPGDKIFNSRHNIINVAKQIINI